MAVVLGVNCKFYYSPTPETMATGEDPSDISDNTLVTSIGDLTLNLEKGEHEINTRAGAGWRSFAEGLKNGSISISAPWDPADTFFSNMLTWYIAGTKFAAVALDGVIATSGSQGFAANFGVFNMTRNEPVDGPATADIEIKPDSLQQWYTVTP